MSFKHIYYGHVNDRKIQHLEKKKQAYSANKLSQNEKLL
jgi:hypothetical protein